MSPTTRKGWDDSTLWILRLVAGVVLSVLGFCGVIATNSITKMGSDMEIIKVQVGGMQETRISNDRRFDELEVVSRSHAVDIQGIKIDIREIQTKLKLK